MGLRDGGERGVAVGDVEFDGHDGVAVLGDEVVERGRVTRGGGDAVARGERGLREGTAEAARRAGDEPGAIRHAVPLPATTARSRDSAATRRRTRPRGRA